MDKRVSRNFPEMDSFKRIREERYPPSTFTRKKSAIFNVSPLLSDTFFAFTSFFLAAISHSSLSLSPSKLGKFFLLLLYTGLRWYDSLLCSFRHSTEERDRGKGKSDYKNSGRLHPGYVYRSPLKWISQRQSQVGKDKTWLLLFAIDPRCGHFNSVIVQKI